MASASLRWLWTLLLAAGLSTSGPQVSQGFDDLDTHPRMTGAAVIPSAVDAFLKDNLGLVQGVGSAIKDGSGKGQTLLKWLQDGSTLEDDPACRASNHFHNPLKPFTSSGVTDLPFWIQAYCALGPYNRITSNVTWGTRFTGPTEKGPATSNTLDWDAARTSYLNALTLSDASKREAALADTFQTLGQVMHLVQDLAVPAHVRNDFLSHLEYFDPSTTQAPTRWFSNGFERFVRLHPALVDGAGALMPTASTTRPVTRFWDVDQYSGTNPSADTIQGLAEYTNANFASQNTILTESLAPASPYAFPYPRQSSTDLADVLAGRKGQEQVVAEDGSVDTGLYVSKVTDGETIPHFLKAGSLTGLFFGSSPLRSILPASLLASTLQIDDVAHRDYAAQLLPRAVGYSTALLDYFFRGKLDVTLNLPDPENATTFTLSGTNASPETLTGGTLSLYADVYNDPAAPDPQTPVRRPISGATDLPVGSDTAVAPGGDLLPTPVTFTSPDAERYVAVYQGNLGLELKDASKNVPGAVIGKVLGGVRAEELVADSGYWKLRTPTGLFFLQAPNGSDLLTTAAYSDVHWGDGDNRVVAMTLWSPAVQVSGFEIPRAEGSIEPATVQTPGGPAIPLTLVAQAGFPFGLAMGITAQLNDTVHYSEQLVRETFHVTWHWVSYGGGSGAYTNPTFDTPLTFETVAQEDIPLQASYALALDPDHTGSFGSNYWYYWWDLQEVNLTADGHLTALVYASLSSIPEDDPSTVTRPLHGLTPAGEVQELGEITLGPSFNQDNRIWVLVDLTANRILATTSAPTIQLTTEQYVVSGFLDWWNPLQAWIWGQITDQYVGGGPLNGQQKVQDWGRWGVTGWSQQGQPAVVVNDPIGDVGTAKAEVTWLRDDLARALPPELISYHVSSGEQPQPYSAPFGYPCGDPQGCGLQLIATVHELDGWPADFPMAQRTHPAPATGERLVFLPESWTDSVTATPVIAWDPALSRVSSRFQLDTNAWGWDSLGPATASAVLVTDASLALSYLVALEGPTSALPVPGIDLRYGYALLAPQYVYDTTALRFLRTTAPTGLTALPRLLTLTSDPYAWGYFHVVRVP